MTTSSVLDSLDFSLQALSSDARKACGLDLGAARTRWAGQIAGGTWWAFTIALANQGRSVSVRLAPGQAARDGAVVLCRGNTCITLATSLGHALPVLIYYLEVHRIPGGWSRLQERWPRVEDELVALHESLGGAGRLEALRDVLFDDRLAVQAGIAAEGVLSEILCRLDPSPSHVAYRKYAQKAISERDAPLPLPEGLGPWKEAATTVAYVTPRSEPPRSIELRAAWDVLRISAALDTGQIYMPRHLFTPITTRSQDMLLSAAAKLIESAKDLPEAWREEPMWHTVEAMASEGRAYTGLAHMEAARDLDLAGRPEEAFTALTSAAFWSSTALGTAFLPALEAARYLAENHGWTEIGEILNTLWELREAR